MTGIEDQVRLTDGVVVLRPFRLEDGPTLVEQQDDAMVRWLQWERPLDHDSGQLVASRWETSWRTHGPERNFAIVDATTGDMVGDCEVEDLGDGTANLMYAVFPPWRGRGFATHAARLLVVYARETFPHAAPILRIHEGNVASESVARALGAVFDGTSEPSRLGLRLKRYRLP